MEKDYINGTIINEKDLGLLYHLLRRREYYWTWYEDNNTSREELVNYLLMHPFQKDNKLYQLCQEMHFIKKGTFPLIRTRRFLIRQAQLRPNRSCVST